MLNNIFFTIVFFILDHFFIWLIFLLICLIVMKYAYKKWQNESIASDVRFISLIILILLVTMFMINFIAIIYVISMFILYFYEIGTFTGKWSTMFNYVG
jgi:hypothetical protein